ncbi:uncharacterized protein N7529_002486 [Penicillium soppii]|uniref:uncharacterized protein n=1 Tax=Penicillium soppii TaxID=69789 RepID=UPI002548917C|nr:uncharacterized protein N7529_002486 [Penicillium soppii]KAJ5874056.1 hypothetical protein N7529_002486 [Penicillium soppii]
MFACMSFVVGIYIQKYQETLLFLRKWRDFSSSLVAALGGKSGQKLLGPVSHLLVPLDSRPVSVVLEFLDYSIGWFQHIVADHAIPLQRGTSLIDSDRTRGIQTGKAEALNRRC